MRKRYLFALALAAVVALGGTTGLKAQATTATNPSPNAQTTIVDDNEGDNVVDVENQDVPLADGEEADSGNDKTVWTVVGVTGGVLGVGAVGVGVAAATGAIGAGAAGAAGTAGAAGIGASGTSWLGKLLKIFRRR